MHVFVYGTLLPGQPRWPLIAAHVRHVEPAAANGTLYDTGRGYPAAVFRSDATTTIPGARLAIADAARELLDEIEGEGVLYRRVEIATDQGPAVSYEWLGPVDTLEQIARWPRT